MGRVKFRALIISVALLSGSCASWFKSGPTPEEVADSAGQLLDSAEKALEAIDPEQGESLLAKAKDELTRPELAESPLRAPLEARRQALFDRLPEARARALEVRVAAAKSTLEGALERAREGAAEVEGKQPPEEAFDTTRAAIETAKGALDQAKSLEAQKPEFATAAEAARTELAAISQKLEARWAVVELEVRRASLQERAKAVDAAIGAKDPATAATAAKSLSEAIEKGSALETKDKAYARVAAGAKQALARAEIFAHRAAVEAQNAKIEAALAALTDVTPELYERAETAVSDLRKTLSDGAPLGEKDRRYAAYLAAMERSLDARRLEIRKRRIDAADAAVVKRLETLISDDDFAEAEKALHLLENTIESNKDFLGKAPVYARYAAGAEKRIAVHRARIEARTLERAVEAAKARVEAASKQVDDKIAALGDTPSDAELDQAGKTVSELESEIDAASSTQDQGFASYLANMKKKVPALRTDLERRRIAAAVAASTVKVQALDASLDTTLGALEGAPEPAAFEAAAAAAEALKAAVEGEGETAKKDPKHAAQLAALEKKAAGANAIIERRRSEVLVAKNRAEVDAAVAKVDELAKSSDFEAALAAVAALEKAVADGADAAGKDRRHAAYLVGLGKRIVRDRAAIEARRTAAEVSAHRTKVDEAMAAYQERLKALTTTDPSLYQAASEALVAVQHALEEGAPLIDKDKKHAAYLGGLKNVVLAQRFEIEKRRVDAAEAEALEAQKGEVPAAEQALERFADTVESKKALLEQSPQYARRVKAAEQRVAALKSGLQARKLEQAITEHRAKVEAAEAALVGKVALLEGDAAPEAFAAADLAASAVETELSAGAPLGEKDKRYAAQLDAAGKRTAARRAEIAKRRDAQAVAQHRAKVEQALAEVNAKLEALTEVTPSLYGDAVEATSALKRMIDEGADLAERDRAYASYLAKMTGQLAGFGQEIRKRRIDANDAMVQKLLEALPERPDDQAFAEVEKALRLFENTVESSKPFLEKDKAYAKFSAQAERRLAERSAALAKKHVDAEVAAHRAAVEPALAAAVQRLDALGDKPEEGDFDAAEAAVSKLEETLDGGTEAAKKDRAHAGYLAGIARKLPAFKAAVARRRTEVAVETHRAEVESRTAAVKSAVDALGGDAKPAAFDAATSAISALDEALSKGDALRDKDRKYAAYLDGVKKQIPGYTAAVARRKREQEVAVHRAAVDEAAGALDQQLGALDGDSPSFDAAAAAVDALATAIDAAGDAAQDPNHARYLAGLKKRADGARGTIERKKAERAAAKHRAKVEAAATAVKERLDALTAVDPSLYEEAERAVSALRSAVQEGGTFAEKDPKYGKYLASMEAVVETDRLEIRKRRIDATRAAVEERLAALSEPSDAAFAEAEKMLHLFENTIQSNEKYMSRDKAYAKHAAQAAGQVAGYQARIDCRKVELEIDARRSKVESLSKAAGEKMDALEGAGEDGAFSAAERAVAELAEMLDGNDPLEAKDKAYRAYCDGERKQVAGWRRRIDRGRLENEVRPHRERIDQAKEKVGESLGALAGQPGEEAFSSAEAAASELASALEEGEPFAKRSPELAKYLAAGGRTLAGARRRIENRRTEVKRAEQREKLDAAATEVDEKMAALENEAAPEAFDAAAGALEALSTAIAEGIGSLGKDKRLTELRKRLPEQRRALARKRVEGAIRRAEEKIDALEKPEGIRRDRRGRNRGQGGPRGARRRAEVREEQGGASVARDDGEAGRRAAAEDPVPADRAARRGPAREGGVGLRVRPGVGGIAVGRLGDRRVSGRRRDGLIARVRSAGRRRGRQEEPAVRQVSGVGQEEDSGHALDDRPLPGGRRRREAEARGGGGPRGRGEGAGRADGDLVALSGRGGCDHRAAAHGGRRAGVRVGRSRVCRLSCKGRQGDPSRPR